MALNFANAADWQRRASMAVPVSTSRQYSESWLASHSYSSAYDHYEAAYDNASTHCWDDIYFQCPGDQPVLMIALRWAKIFILKVGRMYYGAPICLMVFPLLVGLAMGYAMGIRHDQEALPQVPRASRCFSLYRLVRNLWSCLSAVCFLPAFLFSTEFQQRHLEFATNDPGLVKKEERIRQELKGPTEASKESNVDVSLVPKHIAVIMDGNRRYGKKYHPENPTQGHWDGSKTLVSFCKWCIAEQVQILTVYAFSTENWNRSADEVAALMAIFSKYCDELRVEAIQRNIRIRVLSTETDRVSPPCETVLAVKLSTFGDDVILMPSFCRSPLMSK